MILKAAIDINCEKKAILAGVLISVGALFSLASAPYGNVVQGLCFSVGLFGVLCCGARLFTGQMLMTQDGWDGKVTRAELLATWYNTWSFNLLGAAVVASVANGAGIHATDAAIAKAALPSSVIFAKAILCNVLVCLAVWCFRSSDGGPVNAFFSALLPVACFVACGFEHSVADMFYMLSGLGVVGFHDCLRVVVVATLGNVVGGTMLSWMVYR